MRKEGKKVLKSVLQKLVFYLRENMTCCLICAATLLCGMLIGAVWAVSLSDLDTKELSLYFADFFGSFVQNGTDSSVIFADALRLQIFIFGLLFLCSGTIFGSPLIAVVGIGLGASFGFSAVSFLKCCGIRALLFLPGAVLPHSLLMLPCHFALLCVCMRFSVWLWKERAELKTRLLSHVFTIFALFGVAFAAVLLQTYIEPLLVGFVAPYFVA